MNKADKESEKKLQKLIAFLEARGVSVKSDRGNFKGGLVRYYDDHYFYLNRRLDIEARINLILEEITKLDLEPADIDEEISEILAEYKKNESAN